MNKNCYIRQIRGEKALMLFSYLQTLSENSRFSSRLMSCTENVILDMKHRKHLDWDILQDKLENGTLIEDPQEHLFSHLVHTEEGSFTVFPGPFMFYQYNLSRLLEIARLSQIPKNELGIVYVLLQISQIIAERCNVERYSIGNPNRENVYIPDRKNLYANIDKLNFSKNQIEEICDKYSVDYNAFEQLVFKAKRKDIRKSMKNEGYSDAITLTPFFKYDTGYILLSPSAILHSAYNICKDVLKDKLGEALFGIFSKILFNETACVLRKIPEPFLGEFCVDGINCLLYAEDDTKAFCIVSYVGEKRYPLNQFYAKVNSFVRNHFNKYSGISMFVVVYSQIDDLPFPLMVPKNVIALSIDEFNVVMSQPEAKLLTLYYYLQDKMRINVFPPTQEIDLLALYSQKEYNFYFKDKIDELYVEIGNALSLRGKYYVDRDEHYVYSPFLERRVPVVHAHDISTGIPIYEPLYPPESYMFLMLEIEGNALYVQYEAKNQLCYEVVHSVLLWLYAAFKVKHIAVLKDTVYVKLNIVEKEEIVIEQMQRVYAMNLLFGQKKLVSPEKVEEELVNHFVTLLIGQGVISEEFTSALIHSMFEESGGHFMLTDVQNGNPLIKYDGTTSCHYVSHRWVDKILDEIADYLKIKGSEKKLSIAESKAIMVRVMQYLNQETLEILKSLNTQQMLDSCLRLHHAMIYWSRLTYYRFKYISSAYRYIGSDFENQERYANDYSEMNTLVQCIIEKIIHEDFHSDSKTFNIETLDRLFALMHHIVNMGIYFDMLNGGIAESEILILQNGRIDFPKIIKINNDYISVLRSHTLEYQNILINRNEILPHYEINLENQAFQDAFIAEFGISINQFFEIQKRSVEYANEHDSPIVRMPKELFVRVILGTCLENQEVAIFFDNFVLSKEVFVKVSLKDKLPQRFNRSVQLSTRPWILYDDEIFYSSKSLYVSHQVMIERLDSGIISHSSKLMNSYIGQISKEKGELFTRSIGKYYREIPNCNIAVNLEVQICPGKILNAKKNLGDIDVLLINTDLKKIVCIEAKDYYEARTIYDMMSQNKKIEAALSKVLARDTWCKENKLQFNKYVKEVDESYEVKTLFLTYYEPTYKYFSHLNEVGIPMLSAFEIIQNPFIVFN